MRRVPTTVAIELAASWRPLRTSNASATTIRPISRGRASWCTRASSGVSDYDVVDLVRDVLEGVHDPFEVLVDLARDDELHRVVPVPLERALQPFFVNPVDLAFEPHDLFRDAVDLRAVAADVAQQRNGLGSKVCRFGDHSG